MGEEKSKEDLHKRLESKVLGILDSPEDGKKEAAVKPKEKERKSKPKPAGTENPEPEKPEAKKDETDAKSAPKQKGEEKQEDKKKEPEQVAEEKKEGESPKPETSKPASEQNDEKQSKEDDAESVPQEPDKAQEKTGDEKSAGKKGENKDEGSHPKEKPKESIDDLLAQREEIEALLSSIEDSYRDATLPDKTYHEVKSKNEKKLEDLSKKIHELEKTATPEQLLAIQKTEAEANPAEPAAPASTAEEPAVKPDEKPSGTQPAGTKKAGTGASGVAAAPEGRGEALIKLLEEKIEARLRDVISSAGVEVTDKRLKKNEARIDSIETLAKDMKGTLDKTSQSVGGYDKQFTMMKTDVEKTKAMVDGVKEAKNIMDEKLQRMTESFAEIRSIVYQREAKSKEEEVLLDKLKDTVSQVDTARILREFTTRDEQLRDVNTRLERLERSGKMLSDSLNRIKGLMTDIGSLENIIKASKHVGEKLEKIQEIEERMKASSSKLDGVYVDMKKKLDEFSEYKVKQDKLSGMADDTVKNLEEMTRRLSDYATKADMTAIKDELKIVRDTARKAPAAQPASAVDSIQEEKEEIETLLSTLEENYKNKEIGEEEYKKARESNLKKIQELEAKAARSKPAAAAGSAAGTESTEGGKHTKVMLLAKLRESYENGELSKNAYDKSRKLLLSRK